MTAQQAIDRANQLKAGNAVPDDLKLEWLTEVDQTIYNDSIKMHLHDKNKSSWWITDDDGKKVFKPAPEYTQDNTGDELIAESPYDVLYVYWLMSKIDLFSQELDYYNNDISLYDNAMQRYKNWYHRQHRSKPTPVIKVGAR